MTEQEILKKFEELGYGIDNKASYMSLTLYKTPFDYIEIFINKVSKMYSGVLVEDKIEYGLVFDLKYHQLLHELFKCYKWIE